MVVSGFVAVQQQQQQLILLEVSEVNPSPAWDAELLPRVPVLWHTAIPLLVVAERLPHRRFDSLSDSPLLVRLVSTDGLTLV